MSPSLKLQKWQANQLFEAIQGVELDPREFKFENSDSEVHLKHKWSASYFIFDDDAWTTYAERCLVGDAIHQSLPAVYRERPRLLYVHYRAVADIPAAAMTTRLQWSGWEWGIPGAAFLFFSVMLLSRAK